MKNNKSVIRTLTNSEIKKNSLYFDVQFFKTFDLPLGINDLFTVIIIGESRTHSIRYDNGSNGRTIHGLNFIKNNKEKLFKNRNVLISLVDMKPLKIRIEQYQTLPLQ